MEDTTLEVPRGLLLYDITWFSSALMVTLVDGRSASRSFPVLSETSLGLEIMTTGREVVAVVTGWWFLRVGSCCWQMLADDLLSTRFCSEPSTAKEDVCDKF